VKILIVTRYIKTATLDPLKRWNQSLKFSLQALPILENNQKLTPNESKQVGIYFFYTQ
jgi:hypothetical protein